MEQIIARRLVNSYSVAELQPAGHKAFKAKVVMMGK